MKSNRYIELQSKLTRLLSVDEVNSSVSPTLSEIISIDKSLDIENLTKNELLLIHVLLHKFYRYGNKRISKTEIEKLHKQVSKRINHQFYDDLDKYE